MEDNFKQFLKDIYFQIVEDGCSRAQKLKVEQIAGRNRVEYDEDQINTFITNVTEWLKYETPDYEMIEDFYTEEDENTEEE